MKQYLIFAMLLLTALPGFGSKAQPGPSSQFHVKRMHEGKTNRKLSQPAHEGAPVRRATPQRIAESGRKGRFVNRIRQQGSVSSVSFVAAARFSLSGLDDDNTMQVMGDFNGDGKKDVAKIVTVGSTYNISVLLGNGDGTFQAAILTTTPNNSDDNIVVGDVNGDGKDDIVMVHSGAPASIDVLVGGGDGTFLTAVNYPVTSAALVGGVLADINGDGKLDVMAFDNANPANVIKLPGNGDGTFQSATPMTVLSASAPNNMIFADFNGDGKLDFAGDVNGQVQVTLASGSTSFASPVLLTTPDANYNNCSSVAGDLSGDGKPEIVSVSCNTNRLAVYLNNGDGSFQTGVYYNNNGDQNQSVDEPTIADLNGDGKNDVVVVNSSSGDVSVFLGDGEGAIQVEPLCYDVGGFAWAAPLVADFNGDGLMDVVESDDEYNLVYLQGYGDGSFRGAPSYDLPNSFAGSAYTYSVASGDFNGDGVPDVVVGQQGNNGSTGVVVYLAKGDGTFFPGVSYGASAQLRFVAVADFNGDGKLDIAAIDKAGLVQILLGDGDGSFSIGAEYPTDPGNSPDPQNVVTGDFNHDGKMDLAVANPNTGTVGVLLGHGDGTFASVVSYPVTNYTPVTIATTDLNGDGYLDLAVTAYTDGPPAVGILLANNDNSGTFKAPTFYVLDGNPENLTFGDLNKDGKADMAVTLYNGITYPGTIEIALGNGDGTFQTGTDYPSSTFGNGLSYTDPADIQMIDLNGDGNMDLVYLNSEVGTVAFMPGNGDGTMSAPLEFPATEYVWGMALADVNNDGSVDVLAGNDESGGVSVLLNAAGSGTAQTYTLGTQTPSATVTAGGSANYTLDLAGRNGYNGTITFACSNLPIGATCSFSPASVIANGNVPVSTVVTIQTTAGKAGLAPSVRPGTQPGSPVFLACLGGMGLFGMLLLGMGRNSGLRRTRILPAFTLVLMLAALVGCDKDSRSTSTLAGAYIVTVTSTGTGSGAPTHSLNLTLFVQ